nr:hypothetical protein [Tanacetum cinerariifolium]
LVLSSDNTSFAVTYTSISFEARSWKPVYLEYLAPSDDEIPTEYLPTDASLIALSSSYIGDSDPEEDEEILEEDHVDYPVDKEDDDDESSDDDDVEEDDEEEEH